MEQVYTPNVKVGATRGYCLQYVDDAGNAPKRTATAKIAYTNEKKAGRISSGIDSPKGVWVVGFMSFTKGAYVAYGHVFLMKHLGSGKYQIYDSEVASGARKVYGSLAEIAGWFGAYGAKYLGWSPQCDGRVYAKNKEKEMTEAEKKLYAQGQVSKLVRRFTYPHRVTVKKGFNMWDLTYVIRGKTKSVKKYSSDSKHVFQNYADITFQGKKRRYLIYDADVFKGKLNGVNEADTVKIEDVKPAEVDTDAQQKLEKIKSILK